MSLLKKSIGVYIGAVLLIMGVGLFAFPEVLTSAGLGTIVSEYGGVTELAQYNGTATGSFNDVRSDCPMADKWFHPEGGLCKGDYSASYFIKMINEDVVPGTVFDKLEFRYLIQPGWNYDWQYGGFKTIHQPGMGQADFCFLIDGDEDNPLCLSPNNTSQENINRAIGTKCGTHPDWCLGNFNLFSSDLTQYELEGGYHTLEAHFIPTVFCHWKNEQGGVGNCIPRGLGVGGGIPDEYKNYYPLSVAPIEFFIEDAACAPEPGQNIFAQAFPAGTTVTLDSFEHKPTTFCKSMPIQVFRQGQRAEQKDRELFQIRDGGFITVPDDSTWVFTYIGEMAKGLPFPCEVDEVLEASGDCVPTPSYVFTCADGILIEGKATCITSPEHKDICPFGGTAFYEDDVFKYCIVLEREEATIIVPEGATFDEDLEGWKYDAEKAWVCESGVVDETVDPPVCESAAIVSTEEQNEVQDKKILGTIIPFTLMGIGGVLMAINWNKKGKRRGKKK